MQTQDALALSALLVSVVALLVTMTQLIQTWILAFMGLIPPFMSIFFETFRKPIPHPKLNAAAIGSWSRLQQGSATRRLIIPWLPPRNPMPVHFVQPKLEIGDIINNVDKFQLQSHNRNEIKEDSRALARSADDQLRLRLSQTKATWNNLMTGLVIDSSFLHPKRSRAIHVDVETIPSHQDAPSMFIHATEIILCGFLLDMDFCDETLPSVATVRACPARAAHRLGMIGDRCAISASELGAGMPTVSYSCQPGYRHKVRSLSSDEARSLVRTAQGRVGIGPLMNLPLDSLGYNALDSLFQEVLSAVNHRTWQILPLTSVQHSPTPDQHRSWNQRWKAPKTPFMPFLLSFSNNLAVAKAFPHDLLGKWDEKDRNACSKRAFSLIEGSCTFAVSSPELIDRIMERRDTMSRFDPVAKATKFMDEILDGMGTDDVDELHQYSAKLKQSTPHPPPDDFPHEDKVIVTCDEYKIREGYGAERGGQTGWLSSTSSEFTFRMSQFWSIEKPAQPQPTSFNPVPILFQLEGVLRDGKLPDWVDEYTSNPDCGMHWRMKPVILLWMQIALFDAWLGRHVEVMMGGSGATEFETREAFKTNSKCTARSNLSGMGCTPDALEMRERFIQEYAKQKFDSDPPSTGPAAPTDPRYASAGPHPPDEVCVPLSKEEAQKARVAPVNQVSTVGWKRPRVEFAAEYLRQLAEGAPSDHDSRSPSCMAVTAADPEHYSGKREAWEEMQGGERAEEWMMVDAVLSLRAVVQAQRLQCLKDSSVLLGFQERDPVLQMI